MARTPKVRRKPVDRSTVEHATKPVPWAVSEWGHRRFRLDVTLIFLGTIVLAAFVNEILGMWLEKRYEGNGILQSIALTSLTSMVGLITAYMGFAAWDDKNSKDTNVEAMALELDHVAAIEGRVGEEGVQEVETSTETTVKTVETKKETANKPDKPVEPEADASLVPPPGFAEN